MISIKSIKLGMYLSLSLFVYSSVFANSHWYVSCNQNNSTQIDEMHFKCAADQLTMSKPSPARVSPGTTLDIRATCIIGADASPANRYNIFTNYDDKITCYASGASSGEGEFICHNNSLTGAHDVYLDYVTCGLPVIPTP